MKIRHLYFALLVLLANACFAQQAAPTTGNPSLDQFFKDMIICAKGYTGTNEKLSPVSKCAIAKRKPELAIKVYELPCSSKYPPELRTHYCPLGLLELAMVFSDPANEDKNISRSRDYISRLNKEFPESKPAKTAGELLLHLDLDSK